MTSIQHFVNIIITNTEVVFALEMNTKLDNCTRPTEQNHYILIMELHYLGLRLLVQSGQLGEQILAGV